MGSRSIYPWREVGLFVTIKSPGQLRIGICLLLHRQFVQQQEIKAERKKATNVELCYVVIGGSLG